MNRHTFMVLLAAVLWGTTGTAQSFAPDHANPLGIGAVRLAIGGVVLFSIALLTRRLRAERWPMLPTLLTAVSMAIYQPFFFSAVKLTGVAIGTMVAIGSAPILAGLLEWIRTNKAPERSWWPATFCSLIGCMLLVTTNQEVQLNVWGILLALGAGLAFASYTLLSKILLEMHPPEAVLGVVFVVSAFLLLPILFFVDVSWISEWRGVGVALHLGLFATAMAYYLFIKGLTRLPASNGVTLSLAEPLTAALLGIFLLHEQVGLFSLMGIVMIFVGLSILSIRPQSA